MSLRLLFFLQLFFLGLDGRERFPLGCSLIPRSLMCARAKGGLVVVPLLACGTRLGCVLLRTDAWPRAPFFFMPFTDAVPWAGGAPIAVDSDMAGVALVRGNADAVVSAPNKRKVRPISIASHARSLRARGGGRGMHTHGTSTGTL